MIPSPTQSHLVHFSLTERCGSVSSPITAAKLGRQNDHHQQVSGSITRAQKSSTTAHERRHQQQKHDDTYNNDSVDFLDTRINRNYHSGTVQG